jgi:hypothetical protein
MAPHRRCCCGIKTIFEHHLPLKRYFMPETIMVILNDDSK